MDLRSSRDAAQRSLSAATVCPKKLATIHAGVALAVSLALTLVSFLLSRGIGSTSGLTGIGPRSFLLAIQSVLSLASTVLLPFWEIGFLYAALSIARSTEASPASLLEGFRRFGPVLRLFLLRVLIFLGLGMACLYAAGTVYMLTPFAARMYEALEQILSGLSSTDTVSVDPAMVEALLPHMLPMYAIFAALYAAVGIPVFYRLRMADFCIMDDAPGALAALSASGRMMRGNRLSLFRVDLRFWWFYGAQLIAAAVAYAPELLTLAGISLPLDGEVTVFACYLLYAVLQLLLYRQFYSHVQTTYAHCYETLRQAAPPAVTPVPTPKSF